MCPPHAHTHTSPPLFSIPRILSALIKVSLGSTAQVSAIGTGCYGNPPAGDQTHLMMLAHRSMSLSLLLTPEFFSFFPNLQILYFYINTICFLSRFLSFTVAVSQKKNTFQGPDNIWAQWPVTVLTRHKLPTPSVSPSSFQTSICTQA